MIRRDWRSRVRSNWRRWVWLNWRRGIRRNWRRWVWSDLRRRIWPDRRRGYLAERDSGELHQYKRRCDCADAKRGSAKKFTLHVSHRFRVQLAVWTSHLARGGVDRNLWPRLQFTAGAVDRPETPQFWKSEAVGKLIRIPVGEDCLCCLPARAHF